MAKKLAPEIIVRNFTSAFGEEMGFRGTARKTSPSTIKVTLSLSDSKIGVAKARSFKRILLRELGKTHSNWSAVLYVTTNCIINLSRKSK